VSLPAIAPANMPKQRLLPSILDAEDVASSQISSLSTFPASPWPEKSIRCQTPGAIFGISNNRLIIFVVPPKYIYKISIHT